MPTIDIRDRPYTQLAYNNGVFVWQDRRDLKSECPYAGRLISVILSFHSAMAR